MLDAQKRNHASSENESGQVSDPEPAGGNPDAGAGGESGVTQGAALRYIGILGWDLGVHIGVYQP